MTEYLKIEKEKVLAAAKECPDWEKGLKAIFPEAFEEYEIDLKQVHELEIQPCTLEGCEGKGQSFTLSSAYDWRLEKLRNTLHLFVKKRV